MDSAAEDWALQDVDFQGRPFISRNISLLLQEPTNNNIADEKDSFMRKTALLLFIIQTSDIEILVIKKISLVENVV